VSLNPCVVFPFPSWVAWQYPTTSHFNSPPEPLTHCASRNPLSGPSVAFFALSTLLKSGTNTYQQTQNRKKNRKQKIKP